MSRNHENRSPRRHAATWMATSAVALAAGIGAALFTAAPASADHVEEAVAHHVGRVAASHFLLAGEILFGGPPVVEVHHRVAPPPHRHHPRCGHGYGHGKHHAKHHHKHRHQAKHRGHGHDRYAARGGHGDRHYGDGHRRTIPRHERVAVMHRRDRH